MPSDAPTYTIDEAVACTCDDCIDVSPRMSAVFTPSTASAAQAYRIRYDAIVTPEGVVSADPSVLATPERSRPLPMPLNMNPYQDDAIHYLRQARDRLNLEDNEAVEVKFHRPGDAEWREVATRAFHFLRANSDRRYSSGALMRVLTAAEANHDNNPTPPCLFEVSAPSAYDPDTEVKSGGVLGVLFQTNDSLNRALLAVAPTYRRQRVARVLVTVHRNIVGYPTFWVHQRNHAAQRFLLSQEFYPRTVNQQGAVHYTLVDCDEEEV